MLLRIVSRVFARKADDEIAVYLEAQLLAIRREAPRHVDRRALLDVLQYLLVARFVTHDQQRQPASFIAFSVSWSVVTRDVAAPRKIQILELGAQLDGGAPFDS